MEFTWKGSEKPYLDEVRITSFSDLGIGCFGGSTSRLAVKNEDALFVMRDAESLWTFCVLLDAHNSSQSAELILRLIEYKKNELETLFQSNRVFMDLEPYFAKLFADPAFVEECSKVTGETSCLLCFQRGDIYGGSRLGTVCCSCCIPIWLNSTNSASINGSSMNGSGR